MPFRCLAISAIDKIDSEDVLRGVDRDMVRKNRALRNHYDKGYEKYLIGHKRITILRSTRRMTRINGALPKLAGVKNKFSFVALPESWRGIDCH